MKVEGPDDPGMAETKVMVAPPRRVTLRKPCWPRARPVVWKKVVGRAVVVESVWSLGRSK